jgi:hypothetical protein
LFSWLRCCCSGMRDSRHSGEQRLHHGASEEQAGGSVGVRLHGLHHHGPWPRVARPRVGLVIARCVRANLHGRHHHPRRMDRLRRLHCAQVSEPQAIDCRFSSQSLRNSFAYVRSLCVCVCVCVCGCSTSFYAQYKCSGPGAEAAVRVPWSYELNDADVQQFLNMDFIDGASWIHSTRKLIDKIPGHV